MAYVFNEAKARAAGLTDQQIAEAKSMGAPQQAPAQSAPPQMQQPPQDDYAAQLEALRNAPPEDTGIDLGKGAYNLIVRPTVEGAKSAAQIAGTIVSAPVLAATQALDPEQKYTKGLQDISAKVLEASGGNEYSDNALERLGQGELKVAMGGLTAANMLSLGQAGLAQGGLAAAQMLGKQALTNLAVNAGIYGTGGAIKANREGKDVATAFGRGVTGQDMTGIVEGATGDTKFAPAVDLIISIAAPMLVGHAVDKVKRSQAYSDFKTNVGDAIDNNGVVKDIRGRMATSVGRVDGKGVGESEKLLTEALQMTDAKTPRGFAKQLEQIPAKAGKIVDANIGKLDSKIGMMPADGPDGFITDVMNKVRESPVAVTSPKLANKVNMEIAKYLDMGSDPAMMQGGATMQTNLTKVNEARKIINAKIPSSWFNNGMQTTDDTGKYYDLLWKASNGLKDTIIQADDTGQITRAINLQHVAMATKSAIADAALHTNRPKTLYGFVQKMFGAFYDPAQLNTARATVGQGDAVQQMIRSGNLPDIPQSGIPSQIPQQTTGLNTVLSQMKNLRADPEIATNPEKIAQLTQLQNQFKALSNTSPTNSASAEGFTRRPLDSNVLNPIQNNVQVKNPQSKGLPDLTQETRSVQENVLRQAAKKGLISKEQLPDILENLKYQKGGVNFDAPVGLPPIGSDAINQYHANIASTNSTLTSRPNYEMAFEKALNAGNKEQAIQALGTIPQDSGYMQTALHMLSVVFPDMKTASQNVEKVVIKK